MTVDARPPRGPRASGWALLVLVLATLGIMGLDAGHERAGPPEALRSAGATVTGPLLTAIAGTFPEPAADENERAELSASLALTEEALAETQGSDRLLAADHVTLLRDAGHELVLARIVALGAVGPAGPERLTIDVGERDGVALDQTVVASGGLVGRTVRVGASTSDVLILGAADLVMGARAADSGLLGTVRPPGGTATAPRSPGQLTFAAIAFGDLAVGEEVRTLGSPDNVPFVAGIPIGVVSEIDASRGRVGLTAAIDPNVDVGSLDVVAVVVPGDAGREGQ